MVGGAKHNLGGSKEIAAQDVACGGPREFETIFVRPELLAPS
jgi:hypothetical protein